MKASFLVGLMGIGFLDPDPNGSAVGDAFAGGELGTVSIFASCDVFLSRTLAWENEVTVGYRGESVRATQAHLIACRKDASSRNRWTRIPAHLCDGRCGRRDGGA